MQVVLHDLHVHCFLQLLCYFKRKALTWNQISSFFCEIYGYECVCVCVRASVSYCDSWWYKHILSSLCNTCWNDYKGCCLPVTKSLLLSIGAGLERNLPIWCYQLKKEGTKGEGSFPYQPQLVSLDLSYRIVLYQYFSSSLANLMANKGASVYLSIVAHSESSPFLFSCHNINWVRSSAPGRVPLLIPWPPLI